jgi:Protein of unknown function (DUF2939)
MFRLVRRLLVLGILAGALGAAYIAVPFWTAWTIREAIKANDSAYLEKKIEWATVRATLKESLGKFAFTAQGDMTELPEKPSLWQRIKTYVGQGAVDRFVDTTVTPTGMSGLLTMRKAYQDNIAGNDAATRPPIWERLRRVWSRVTRAEFQGLDRFEMDMIDKAAPERTINCVLERRGFEWRMTELRVKATDPAKLATVRPLLAMQ